MVQLEPALVIAGLAALAWFAYQAFLRGLTADRHRLLGSSFSNLAIHLASAAALLAAYQGLRFAAATGISPGAIDRVSSYVGVVTLLSGSMVFVKTSRILVLQYLFIGHMRAGVPILLVNLFTLLLSIILGGWLFGEIFNVNLTPLLATSAVLSLVLGLALQDTLGNLFAGVALQFDKPYEIGDWIEIQAQSQKWIGQVQEISWRATVLVGFSDETLTIPNRVVAQAEVSNYSTKRLPIVRSQIFRLPYGVSLTRAKEVLLSAAGSVPQIRLVPAPLVIATEAGESWIAVKLVYSIDDYGAQFVIADQVITAALKALAGAGIPLASARLSLTKEGPTPC